MSRFWTLIAICCMVVMTTADEDWEPELKYTDKSDWVDPGDMMNYDTHTQTMRNKKGQCDCDLMEERLADCNEENNKCKVMLTESQNQQQSPELKETCRLDCDCNKLQTTIQQCEESKDSVQKSYQSCIDEKSKTTVSTGTQTCEEVYFKQFIKSLVNRMRTKVRGDEEVIQLEYIVHLTSRDWAILSTFRDNGAVNDAHSVLSHMIKRIHPSVKPVDTWKLWLEDVSGTDFQTLVLFILLAFGSIAFIIVIVAVPISSGYSWQRQIVRGFIILLVVSVPWTWIHLYKHEVAKKQSTVMKDIPDHCKPGGAGVISGINEWVKSVFTFSGDSCAQYHEALMVDPFWDVPPTQAIVVTISKFVLKPLEHLGEALGKFFLTLYKDLPIQVWPVVTFILIIVVILMLIMMFGYSIRFPFMGGIEAPSRIQHERLTQEERLMIQNANEQRKQIEQLEQENEALHQEKQILEEEREQLMIAEAGGGGGDADIERIQEIVRDDGPPNKKSKLEEMSNSQSDKLQDLEKKPSLEFKHKKAVHETGTPTPPTVKDLYFPDEKPTEDISTSPAVEEHMVGEDNSAVKPTNDDIKGAKQQTHKREEDLVSHHDKLEVLPESSKLENTCSSQTQDSETMTPPEKDSPVHAETAPPEKDSPVHAETALPEKDSPLHADTVLPEEDAPVHAETSPPEKDSPVHAETAPPEKDSQVHAETALPEKDSLVHVEKDIPGQEHGITFEKDSAAEAVSSGPDQPPSEGVSSSSDDIDVIEQRAEEEIEFETPSSSEAQHSRVFDLPMSTDESTQGATGVEHLVSEARGGTLSEDSFLQSSCLTESTEVISRDEPYEAVGEYHEHSESEDDFVVLRKESMEQEAIGGSSPCERPEGVEGDTEHNISALSLD